MSGVELKVEIIPGGKVEGDDVPVLINITPPEGTARTPSDICCVIDVSGSMGNEASVQDANGQTETQGLTLLDIAKHGVRTIAQSLGGNDRLSIVRFSHESSITLELTKMDEEGKKAADTAIDTLHEGGGTNIWLGLEKGMDTLRSGQQTGGRYSHVLLLTDGETEGKDTLIQKMEDYRQQYERLPGSVNTFGFGYNINSPLLVDMAEGGSGSYAFIPDAGFVGTCFVNSLSNLLTTAASDVVLVLEADSGAEIVSVPGGHKVTKQGDATRVSIGSLQFGQSRGVVVRMKKSAGGSGPYLVAATQYTSLDGKTVETGAVEGESQAEDAVKVSEQVQRCAYVDTMGEVYKAAKANANDLQTCVEKLLQLAKDMKASPSAEQENVKALLEDIEGQSIEAFSKQEYWAKWGRHYVPSIQFAHRMQQCNNFKDPGVQKYGGKLFEDLKDEADEAFNNLPAPKPSRRSYSSGGSSSAPVSMAAYNNCYGG